MNLKASEFGKKMMQLLRENPILSKNVKKLVPKIICYRTMQKQMTLIDSEIKQHIPHILGDIAVVRGLLCGSDGEKSSTQSNSHEQHRCTNNPGQKRLMPMQRLGANIEMGEYLKRGLGQRCVIFGGGLGFFFFFGWFSGQFITRKDGLASTVGLSDPTTSMDKLVNPSSIPPYQVDGCDRD